MKKKLICTSYNSQFSRDLEKNHNQNFDLFFLSKTKNSSKKNIFSYTSTAEIPAVIRKKKPDIIWHNMAISQQKKSFLFPNETFNTNFLTTVSLVEEIKNLKKKPLLVFFSSSAVYSQKINIKITEKDILKPTSPYGFSKLYSEEYIKFSSKLYGFKYIILRPFLIISSYKKNGVVYDFNNKIKNYVKYNKNIIVGDIKNIKRDFLDVKIANRMILNLLKNNIFNETFNVCSSIETSLHDIFLILCKKYNKKINYKVDKNLSNIYENNFRVGNNRKILKYCNSFDLNIMNYL